MNADDIDSAAQGNPKELRLALVCYGGVSLAIYMHGMTKELHKLVDASRRFDVLGPESANPYRAESDSEHAYFETLRDLAASGRPLTVNIDVIAGTSAGGINGVCLAKVLACNGSQEDLKKLWIKEGDFATLLHAPPIGTWKFRALLAAVRMAGRLLRPGGPLRGDRMSRLLHAAIGAMDVAVDERTSLIPAGRDLELFVTTTDLDGCPMLVPTGAGGATQWVTEHAQVLQFRAGAGSGAGDLGPTGSGALAFAARATSSFPGAFPPVSLKSFATELDGASFDASSVTGRFRHRYPPGMPTAWFVDGGLLDNAPFDLVVAAIAGKRAESEVVRRLVYLQPDPDRPLTPVEGEPVEAPEPGYLPGLYRAVIGVKGSHSILRDLLALRDMNARIGEVAAIADLQQEQVRAAIEEAWGSRPGAAASDVELPWDITDLADVAELAAAFHRRAESFVGAGFPAYNRLKVEAAAASLAIAVARRFGDAAGSPRAHLVEAVLGVWTRARVQEKLTEDQLLALLGPVDLPYRQRRLMFLLAGINSRYAHVGQPGAPTRAQLDALKSTAWTMLDQLNVAAATAVSELDPKVVDFLGPDLSVEELFADPDGFAAKHDEDLAALYAAYRERVAAELGRTPSAALWEAFAASSTGWAQEHRRFVLSRYLGFPWWDALVFPTIALSEIPQFSPIRVSQFSPDTPAALSKPGGLAGMGLHHFGAFADPTGRENDYLWGRLDAAELILRMLRAPGGAADPPGPTTSAQAVQQAGPHLGSALAAILTNETADLGRIGGLIAELQQQLAVLPVFEARRSLDDPKRASNGV